MFLFEETLLVEAVPKNYNRYCCPKTIALLCCPTVKLSDVGLLRQLNCRRTALVWVVLLRERLRDRLHSLDNLIDEVDCDFLLCRDLREELIFVTLFHDQEIA